VKELKRKLQKSAATVTIFTIDDNDTVVWSLKNLCSPSASAALSFSGFIVTTNLTVVSVLYSL
jgi:alpha-D-ribose 1-methylphosphonate 5-triphosphate synthase subunit PhnH